MNSLGSVHLKTDQFFYIRCGNTELLKNRSSDVPEVSVVQKDQIAQCE